ncbi:response regulator transcription factor [Paenibacillus massiliensis]|uniref:response regulator transcription factor n=1 Tax=Paenibacillus massiliensis TaxID=225917 RepID=UPI000A0010C7|nr:response regulator [Paenibacillus massiliensis]
MMSVAPLRTFVVEDDYGIASLCGVTVTMLEGYELIGLSDDSASALERISAEQPDIVLLEVSQPDGSGMQLLHHMDRMNLSCDVVLVLNGPIWNYMMKGLQLDIFGYLMKPFDTRRLQDTLQSYRQYRMRRDSLSVLKTRLTENKLQSRSISNTTMLKKEMEPAILGRIQEILGDDQAMLTSRQIAEQTGISLTTVRSYLKYMVRKGTVKECVSFGTTGIPLRSFQTVAEP